MSPDRHTGRPGRDHIAEQAVELTVIAKHAGVKIVHVRRYLEFGLFEPQPAGSAETPRFNPGSAARVARAERLRQDLGLNYAGAVLACELLDRISELEARRPQDR
jgi:DNA-binding transcriptional MerR regulator